MQLLPKSLHYEETAAPMELSQLTDFSQYKPCSDEVFKLLKSIYDYPPSDLDAEIHAAKEWSPGIKIEEVSFNATYGGERMIAYLFLPEKGTPPYQVMVYYPGGAANRLHSIEDYGIKTQIDWMVKSNRVVVLPIYKGTFQRQHEPVEKDSYIVRKNRAQKTLQDLRRTIDYLETRSEIDATKIGFYGISTGAVYASIVPAIDERIKATVVSGAGLAVWLDFQNQFNFVPRVKVPVLIIAGIYDTRIPIETRIKPLKELFGTPEEDKHLKLYETGHAVWQSYLWKKDTLDFLDRYFGPAK
jgi:dienelactone hydrolase